MTLGSWHGWLDVCIVIHHHDDSKRDIITTLQGFSCPLDPLFASNLDHHLVCYKLKWGSFWFLSYYRALDPNITWDWSLKALAINAIFFIVSSTKPKMVWAVVAGTLVIHNLLFYKSPDFLIAGLVAIRTVGGCAGWPRCVPSRQYFTRSVSNVIMIVCCYVCVF